MLFSRHNPGLKSLGLIGGINIEDIGNKTAEEPTLSMKLQSFLVVCSEKFVSMSFSTEKGYMFSAKVIILKSTDSSECYEQLETDTYKNKYSFITLATTNQIKTVTSRGDHNKDIQSSSLI